MRRPTARFLAFAALALALVPWFARLVPAVDLLSPALPCAAVLALVALLLNRSGSGRTVPLAALSATGVAAAILLAQATREAPVAGSRLVVVSHNVATANDDPAGTAEALLRSGADVLLLQETEGAFAPYLKVLRRAFPYASPCRHDCALAILSRFPLEQARYRLRDRSGEQIGPPLMQARVRLPGGGSATLVTLHLSRHDSAQTRRRAEAKLVDAVALADGNAMVLGGDFNRVPWSAAMTRLDDRLAPLRRVTRLLFSYPARLDGRRVAFPLVPIDHVYIGPAWGVATVWRLPSTGSDHYPIRADLVWQGVPPMIPAR